MDQLLYDYALAKFMRLKEEVEAALNISFDCKDDEDYEENENNDTNSFGGLEH